MTTKAKEEIESNLKMLGYLYTLEESQLDLIRLMMEAAYTQGHIDGHTQGADQTQKIMERVMSFAYSESTSKSFSTVVGPPLTSFGMLIVSLSRVPPITSCSKNNPFLRHVQSPSSGAFTPSRYLSLKRCKQPESVCSLYQPLIMD